MSGLSIPSRDSPPLPALSRQDVHVWFCPLVRHEKQRAALAALLSRDEQARAARFAFERDRHRFILSHGLLRTILARYVGGAPAQIEFATGAHGKPALTGRSCAGQDIQFSLSHSGEYAVVAVAAGRAVGVDVEVRRQDVDVLNLAQRFFAAGEAHQIIETQGDAQQQLFYRYWTAKEAYLKGRGVGLFLALDQFEILFDDGSPIARVCTRDSGALDTNWQVRSLSLADDISGALAVEGPAWQVRLCDSSTDLFR
ncbi:MAG: 4'-phosphopantetheinyl transferase superfamily protein [Nitrospira sp.]|nr:4'-phosphopantetheinyl transferase superfamily protein [Nitrospira sp.]